VTRPKTATTGWAALALAASAWSYQTPAPRVELLWPGGAPGAVGSEEVDRPTLALYLPAPPAAVGTAVVVCPGGGYGTLALDHEGRQIAEWLNGLGVAGCVLKYRLGPRYRHPAPLQDAARALRYVRSHAAELPLPPRFRCRRAAGKQRRVLPGAAQGGSAGGASRLRARQARRRPGAFGPGAFDLGPAPGGLAESAGATGAPALTWRKLTA